MESPFRNIKSLQPQEANLKLDYPVIAKTCAVYFSGFVPKRSFKIGQYELESKKSILEQFKEGPPGLTKEGFIQIAMSYYAERLIVNVATGEVFLCESSELSHELYEWDKAGRKKDLRLVLGECSSDYFKTMPAAFRFLEKEAAH